MVLPTDAGLVGGLRRGAQPGARLDRAAARPAPRPMAPRRSARRLELGGVLPIARRTRRAAPSRCTRMLARTANDVRHRRPSGGRAQRRAADPADHQGAVRAGSVPRPANLFSHNDQQTTWQAYRPKAPRSAGAVAWATCWPRQPARDLQPISAAGNAVWLAGQDVLQYQVVEQRRDPHGRDSGGRCTARPRWPRRWSTDHAQRAWPPPVRGRSRRRVARSIDAEALRAALKPASARCSAPRPPAATYNASDDPKLRYAQPAAPAPTASNALAQQLQVVARTIEASAAPASARGARSSSSAWAASTPTTSRTATRPT